MGNQRPARRVPERILRRVALGALIFAIAAVLRAAQDHAATAVARQANRSTSDQTAVAEIKGLIAQYAAAVNAEPVDIRLASRVWSNSPEVLLIYPLGEENGWEQVKRNFYENTMEALFSERKLTPSGVQVHAYGDSAWAEFSWHFDARLRKGGSRVESNGRETQIYRKIGPHHWVLVHVHYSAMPASALPNAPAN